MTKRVGLLNLREHLRNSLWFLPAVLVLLCVTLAIGLLSLDTMFSRRFDSRLVFGGGAEGAREVMGTISGSMVSFIGTVFSITVIVLQLASAQFSPRALRNFLQDRRSQLPLGIFIGTLAYSLVVLWTIHSPSDDLRTEFVPNLAISGAYVLVLGSLATFVFYIHHVSQSIRVANIVQQIGCDGRDVLESRYPESFEPARQPRAPEDMRGGIALPSTQHGVITAIDAPGLVEAAVEGGGRIELRYDVGQFVPEGAPVARWTGGELAGRQIDVCRYLSFDTERTMKQDFSFALRQLADIALRALSPSVNDPTTATQALDRMHDLLRQLAGRNFPDEVWRDSDGVPRLVLTLSTWEQIVHEAFDEVLEVGGQVVRLQRHIGMILDDLERAAPRERRAVICELRQLVSSEASD